MNAVSATMVKLDDASFAALRRKIYELTGITLGDGKQSLVANRLQRRLRALGLQTFGQYVAHVSDPRVGTEEIGELINAITTNKTSFFREPHHFDFLMTQVVPELVAQARQGGNKRIRIWCTACSTGQEPWSIAMALQQSLGLAPDWDIKILASDLDTHVLEVAEAATYSAAALAEIPASYRDAAFVRTGPGAFTVIPALRKLVTFRQVNLIERPWPMRGKFDAVFCRNVAIYFDAPTQRTLFESLAGLLTPTGYLFSGHSENLHWAADFLQPVGNTVHQVKGQATRGRVSKRPSMRPSLRPKTSLSKVRIAPLRRPDKAIQAGEVHASATGEIIRTLLGSCVAVCLFDPERRIGGMNHFMLPHGDSEAHAPAYFGIHAMELLINAMMKLGADRERFVAKVFGATQLQRDSGIAANNAAFALDYLQSEGIRIVAQKVASPLPLGVHFDTQTGIARVKEVQRAKAPTEEVEERVMLESMRMRAAPQVTFFEEKS